MNKLMKCPHCNKEFDHSLTPALPFCSEYCQKIDLGHWLLESYRVDGSLALSAENEATFIETDNETDEY